MKKILFYLFFFFTGIATYAQNTPVFSGKQLINVTTVPGMAVGHTPDLNLGLTKLYTFIS